MLNSKNSDTASRVANDFKYIYASGVSDGAVDWFVDVSKWATIIFRKFYSKVGFVPAIVNWGVARRLGAAAVQDG
jgi:hypothetical protein